MPSHTYQNTACEENPKNSVRFFKVDGHINDVQCRTSNEHRCMYFLNQILSQFVRFETSYWYDKYGYEKHQRKQGNLLFWKIFLLAINILRNAIIYCMNRSFFHCCMNRSFKLVFQARVTKFEFSKSRKDLTLTSPYVCIHVKKKTSPWEYMEQQRKGSWGRLRWGSPFLYQSI